MCVRSITIHLSICIQYLYRINVIDSTQSFNNGKQTKLKSKLNFNWKQGKHSSAVHCHTMALMSHNGNAFQAHSHAAPHHYIPRDLMLLFVIFLFHLIQHCCTLLDHFFFCLNNCAFVMPTNRAIHKELHSNWNIKKIVLFHLRRLILHSWTFEFKECALVRLYHFHSFYSPSTGLYFVQWYNLERKNRAHGEKNLANRHEISYLAD